MTESESEEHHRTELPLAEYRGKRDFEHTGEPAGVGPVLGAVSTPRPLFVVQKHDATALHYDFRLQVMGVLKSWAVPKGPSLDPADKRLAVLTEDHPLEYATFEGVIPKGEYGGGTVLVWDFGWWEPDLAWIRTAKEAGPVDPGAALAKGELKFVLHGAKLTGSWALVQMKGRGDKNWLLIKHRDEAARPGTSLVQDAPDSVISGRSLERVAADAAGGA
jgi:bifunctional non-homologous end joining protein LigD